jgi:hypothetical protein
MELMTAFCAGLPDTKVCEDVHQKLRDLPRQKRNNKIPLVTKYAATIRSGVIEERSMACINVTTDQLAAKDWNKERNKPFQTLCNAPKRIGAAYQKIILPSADASPSPHSLFKSAAATSWMFAYWSNLYATSTVKFNDAWVSALVPEFMLLRRKKTGTVVFTLVCTEYALLAWEMEDLGSDVYFMKAGAKHKHKLQIFSRQQIALVVARNTGRTLADLRILCTLLLLVNGRCCRTRSHCHQLMASGASYFTGVEMQSLFLSAPW